MVKDPVVTRALGTSYTVVHAEPLGHPGEALDGVVFLVTTPQPVVMPAGTPGLAPTGETGPVVRELTKEPIGPNSYFFVQISATDKSVIAILPIPDELGKHEAGGQ